jgi:hypothetical protein
MTYRAFVFVGSLIIAVVCVGGCAERLSDAGVPAILKYAPSQTINMVVGQELYITLGTLGPGSYDSPAISAPVLIELPDNGEDLPRTPGGPTQRFRFMAQAPGLAIITLGQSGRSSLRSDTVRDTVIVR